VQANASNGSKGKLLPEREFPAVNCNDITEGKQPHEQHGDSDRGN
jgi:hypothetical protein